MRRRVSNCTRLFWLLNNPRYWIKYKPWLFEQPGTNSIPRTTLLNKMKKEGLYSPLTNNTDINIYKLIRKAIRLKSNPYYRKNKEEYLKKRFNINDI